MMVINGKKVSDDVEQQHIRAQNAAEAAERHTPLGADYALRVLLAQHIQELAPDDDTAARMTALYPEWGELCALQDDDPRKTVDLGYLCQCNGLLWRTRQPRYTFTYTQVPGTPGMEALFEEVCMSYDGTEYDPIPYHGNMQLVAGKYYTQDNVLYLCHTSSGAAVYNKLSELGVFVSMYTRK